jgi:hypothetical protein
MSINKIRKRLHELKDIDKTEDEWADYVDEAAAALGWFIVAFNDMDFITTAAICDLLALGTDQDKDMTFTIMSSKPFSQKIKDLEMLLLLKIKDSGKEAELQKKTKELIATITNLNSERNALVHANWYSAEQDGKDTIVNIRTGIDKLGFYHDYFKCSPEHIEELEDKCEKTSDEIEKLVEELSKELSD